MLEQRFHQLREPRLDALRACDDQRAGASHELGVEQEERQPAKMVAVEMRDQDEVDFVILKYLLRSISGVGCVDSVLALQKRNQSRENVRLVIHYQKGPLRLLHDGTPCGHEGAMRPGHERARLRYCVLFLCFGQKLMYKCRTIGSEKLTSQMV